MGLLRATSPTQRDRDERAVGSLESPNLANRRVHGIAAPNALHQGFLRGFGKIIWCFNPELQVETFAQHAARTNSAEPFLRAA